MFSSFENHDILKSINLSSRQQIFFKFEKIQVPKKKNWALHWEKSFWKYFKIYIITIKVIISCQSWLDQLTRQIKESITNARMHDASDRSMVLITTRFPLYSAAFQFAIVISSSQQDTAERNNTLWSLTRD